MYSSPMLPEFRKKKQKKNHNTNGLQVNKKTINLVGYFIDLL